MCDPVFAWAAVAPDDATPPNFVYSGGVRPTRKEVQRLIGEVWCGEDPRKGWKIAHRRGWRCKRVVIRLAFEKDY